LLVSANILDSWEKTFVERQVTPASAKYHITWKSEVVFMMEKQSMRPIPQAPKESMIARYNLYAEILMQPVHRNLFLVIFDFSFQRRMFLEPSDCEAFTLNCSIYLKFLSQFVWKYSIRHLQKQNVFKIRLLGIFMLKRSMYRKFLLKFEKILLLSFSSHSHSFWHYETHGNSFSKNTF